MGLTVRLSTSLGCAVALSALAATAARAQNTSATWGANSNPAWYTATNWSGGKYAGVQGQVSNNYVATFTSAFTGTTVGINMNTASLSLGAVSLDATRSTATNIGDSSATAGTLYLYGATVNGVADVILRNAGSGLLTLQAAQSGTMTVSLNDAANNIVSIDGSGGITVSSIVTGSGRTLTLQSAGTGVLTLSGVNTFSGGFTLSSGVLAVGASSTGTTTVTGGAVGTGTLTLNGGTLRSDGTTARTINNNLSLAGSITLGDATNTGALTFDNTGLTTRGTALTANTTLTTNSAVAVANAISGAFSLTKSGAGTLTLTGPNTYTGGTTVNNGTLTLSGNGTLGTVGALNVSAGAGVTSVLNLNASQTVNGLAGTVASTGSATINLPSGTVLTTSQTDNSQYDGVLAGAGGLLKTSTGTLFLSNAANSYTGGTTINGGTVAVNGPNRLGSATGALTINGGTFQLTTINGVNTGISSGRNIILGDAGSTMQIDAGPSYTATGAALVSGTGTLNKTGAGALILAGANTYSGGTNVAAGSLLITNTTGSGTGTGAVNVNAGLLGGNGISTGAVTVASGATLLPSGTTAGNTVGRLTVGDGGATTGLTLAGTLQINLAITAAPAAGTNYSQASVIGALTLSTVNTAGTLTLNATANSGLAVGQVLFIVLNDGVDAVAGAFNGQAEGSTVTDSLGDTYTLSYLGNGDAGSLGNDVSLTVLGVTPVPEPATLFGGALLVGVLGWNQRRRLADMARRRSACAA